MIGETKGHLGQSLYLREILGREEGPPPPVDLAVEKKNGDFVRALILSDDITACHDCADGGLLVAIAEMTYRHGIGAMITAEGDVGFWFGEDQGRYVVTVSAGRAPAILEQAQKAGVAAAHIGKTQNSLLELKGVFSVDVKSLREANEAWLPNYMA